MYSIISTGLALQLRSIDLLARSFVWKGCSRLFFFCKSVAWVWEIQPLMGGDTTAAKTKSRPKINRLEFKLFDGKTFFLVNYFISQWWCCVIWEIESRNGFQFRITTAPFFFQITFRVWETHTQWNLRRIPESRNPGFENPESWKLYFPG